MKIAATVEFERCLVQDRLPDQERRALLTDPVFGAVFAEHMVSADYIAGKGWFGARIEPFGPVLMSPATAALHYGQQIFEGLKAYHTSAGGVLLFRPEANARRFQASARRLAMPEVPEELFLSALCALVATDHRWVPAEAGTSLYLRPYLIATEVDLSLRPAAEYRFGVIACPVRTPFLGGSAPLTVWVSAEYVRAAPGGTGAAKCGGNYAASMVPQSQALAAGCDQVIFLDAVERKYVDELGGMNVFFVFDDGTLVTPPLNGAILPGITRESVIMLARRAGHQVSERPYSIDEWRADAARGHLREVFACGTAAAITPIGTVRSADDEFCVGGGETGPVTTRLRTTLLGIQHGRIADDHDWVRRVI